MMLIRSRATTLGAFGLAAGLAVAGGVYGAFTLAVRDEAGGLFLAVFAFALAGAIGGAVLGTIRATPHSVGACAFLAALALGSGLYVTNLLNSALTDWTFSGEPGITLIYLIRLALIGALLGSLLAAGQRRWQDARRLAFAGAIGFALGALVMDRMSGWLAQPLTYLIPGYIGDPKHDSLALALTWAISFAAAGLLAGAILGYALERER